MEEKKELLDQDERVVEIELERLRGFVNHPFNRFGENGRFVLIWNQAQDMQILWWRFHRRKRGW